MPSVIKWGSKFQEDPDDPGYYKKAGEWPADFLNFARVFGKPTWIPGRREAGVGMATIWIKEPVVKPATAKATEAGAFNIESKGVFLNMLVSLEVLWLVYQRIKAGSVGGLILHGVEEIHFPR